MIDAVALETRFTRHTPTPSQIARIETVRGWGLAYGSVILAYAPAGPDRDAAIRKLHECVMTANFAIVTEPDEGSLDDIAANAFTDFFVAFGHGFLKLFGASFSAEQVKAQAAAIASFITTDIGKLALSAVEYVEATVAALPVGATDAEKQTAAIAKRDAALAKLKEDAAAAGKDLSTLAGSTLNWFVETALQYLVAKGLAAVTAAIAASSDDETKASV